MIGYLGRIDFIEINNCTGSGFDIFWRNQDKFPNGIRRDIKKKLLVEPKDFIRVSPVDSSSLRGVYCGTQQEDLPKYNKEGDERLLFFSKRIGRDDLSQFSNWNDFFTRMIIPFKAWILKDQFFRMNDRTIGLIKELVESPSGRLRPGIIILSGSVEERVRQEKYEEISDQIFRLFNRTMNELGITLLFVEREHARSIVTNNDIIDLSNSVHVFWDTNGNFLLGTWDDHINIIPGFLEHWKENEKEYFAEIDKLARDIVGQNPIAFGSPNWMSLLDEYFIM
jgi:hypothetical protein